MKIITDLSNLFRGRTALMEVLFLPPKLGAKYLVIGSKNAQMATVFQYGTNLFTFPYL